jgi:DNA-binding transcriptional LysR family regulator
MRLDLTTLKLFLAVVEERGIARAAKREHITGPAISKRIAELEQALGVRLLERRSSGISPTVAGTALAAEARGVLGTLERLQATLSDYAGGSRGEVRLYSGASGLVGRLPEDLKRFARRYPLVRLRIKELHSQEVVRAVTEGEADIGIYAPHIAAAGLDVHPYHPVRLVLLAPRDHPLARRRRVWLAQAAGYEFVGLADDSALGVLLQRIALERGIALNARLQVTGHEPVRRLVQAGMGIGILPEFCALPYARAMRLACVPLADPWARYTLNICTRPREALPMSARLLLAHLTARRARGASAARTD